MQKQYIKLNENDNHLSLGNLFRIIKELSKNKRSAMQVELFACLFEVDEVNDTTVNNYCVGIRTIGDTYKQIYLNKQKKFNKDDTIFENIIINLLSIIDGNLYNVTNKRNFINTNESFIKLTNKLLNIAKNDKEVSNDIIDSISIFIKTNDYYHAFIKELFFIILDKKQPIYESNLKTEIIENVLKDTSISSNDLKEYLSLTLREGINYDYTLKQLASSSNAYACYTLGIEECNGHIKGYSRYDEAVKYFKIGEKQNHPGCTYMLGYIILKEFLGTSNNKDLENAYNYFIKATTLGNIAAYNSLGLMYLNGIHPLKKDLNKAKECFNEAANHNYVYAFNNLGKIEENNNNLDKAYEYYKKSADLGESWACNKMGEYYRLQGNMIQAFNYYTLGSESNYKTLYEYNYYNLGKYFYLCGSNELNIKKDKIKALECFNNSSTLIESLINVLLIYVEEYLITNKESLYKDILDIKTKIELHPKYNNEIKNIIENNIKIIKENNKINLDI